MMPQRRAGAASSLLPPAHPLPWGTRLNPRFLVGVGAVAALLVVAGLLGLDYPLARWIHASGFENAPALSGTLAVLDAALGMHVWYWMMATILVALGLAGMLAARRLRLPPRLAPALLAAGLVQAGTIAVMILGKSTMGRLRPYQVFETGDWSTIWFAGGVSFPSGHSSWYFGLFLPLAAAVPRLWQRVALLGVPVFAAVTRIDMSMHFLSDVSTPPLVAACLALLVGAAMRRWLPAPM